MKKTLAVISMTSFVFNSFATTLDFRNIIIQNQSVQEQFRLETETTRTEYRQEPVTRTCYRQEIVGYRRVCEDSFDFLSLNAASTIKRERDEEPGHPRRPPPDRPEPGHPPREPRPEPTREPRPEPTREPRPQPTREPRPEPTHEPRPQPTREPRPQPTREPRPEPTREPRPEPTRGPWPEPGHPPRPRPEPTREPWPEPGHPPRPRPEPTREPRPEPTREPRPEPRPPICHDEPIYRTVEYSCTQMETVPYEVLDHRTHANVQIKMSKAPIQLPQTESCGVNFKLFGDQFNIENQCRAYMLYGTHIISGTTQEQSHQLNLTLKEFDRTIRPFLGELANAYIEDGYLKFRVGDFRKAGDFKFRLLIVKQRKTLRDHVLINRELHLNEIEFEENSSNPNVGWARINLDRLIGPMNPNRRYLIKLNLDSLLDEKLIINRNQFPKLHQEIGLFR